MRNVQPLQQTAGAPAKGKLPRWAVHVLFWLGFFLLFGFLYGGYDDNYRKSFFSEAIGLPGKMLVSYLVIYHLMPRYLLKDRLAGFLWRLALAIAVAGLVGRVLSFYVYYPIYYPDNTTSFWFPVKVFKEFVAIFWVVGMVSSIKLIKHWYQQERAKRQLSREKLEAELKLLKSQVHPHFLFNTLNNIYALTLKQSEEAPEAVLKLSELLHYMLYECNTDWVPLEKELKLVDNYIKLEQLRYGARLAVQMQVTGSPAGHQIPPMLILPLIENSFKHGVSAETSDAFIRLDIAIKLEEIRVVVENSKARDEQKDEQGYREGIGLKNVERRLALMYPNSHQLKVMAEEETFLVVLRLGTTAAGAPPSPPLPPVKREERIYSHT